MPNQNVRFAAATVIGGTAASLGGGKFANGAITGAFVYLFNQALEKANEKQQIKRRVLIDKRFAEEFPGSETSYATDTISLRKELAEKSIDFVSEKQIISNIENIGDAGYVKASGVKSDYDLIIGHIGEVKIPVGTLFLDEGQMEIGGEIYKDSQIIDRYKIKNVLSLHCEFSMGAIMPRYFADHLNVYRETIGSDYRWRFNDKIKEYELHKINK